MPDSLKNLRADKLYHDVSVQVGKLVAWAEQIKQEGFSEIPLSAWAASPSEGVKGAIAKAVACCDNIRPKDLVCSIFFGDARLHSFSSLPQATLMKA